METADVLEKLRRTAGIVPPGAAGVHLGVFAEPYLQAIYDGRKTVESRFSKNRIAPYGRVAPGDLVLVKRAAGPVEAAFTVGAVRQYRLPETPLENLRAAYGAALCADEAFWRRKAESRYAVLLEIRGLVRFAPFRVEKLRRTAWVTLRAPQPEKTGK